MACTVTVSGAAVTIEQATLSIQKRVEERSTASFTVIDTAGTADYKRGMPVEITDPSPAPVGSEVIDRSTSEGAGWTYVNLEKLATNDGTLRRIKIWAKANMAGLKVGTFELISGSPPGNSTFKCRASQTIGAVTAGSVQTFDVSLAVQVGDYLGAYWDTGTMEESSTGETMMLFGDHVTQDEESGLFTNTGEGPASIQALYSAVVFAGFIDTPGRGRLSNQGGLLHDITCMDNHYLADKRLVVKSYANQTLGYIVTDIFNSYLAAEGVTIGAIHTGPAIAEAIFNYVRVSDAFDALKELSGYTWFINESKALYFVDRTTYRTSWDLDNSTYRPLRGSVHLVGGNPLYRNKQYVRGGKGVTALQTENFTGDGVLKSFALGYPLALEPTITEDAVYLYVGIKGLESGKDYYWNKSDNSITAEVTPGIGVDIEVAYYGQYPLIAMAFDAGAILDRQSVEGSGSGIVEEMVTEAQHETSNGISQSATGKIQRYCQEAERFTYQTDQAGLSVGQLQAITYPLFGFSVHDMLIESIIITANGDRVLYDVTCITGPSAGSWAKFFANIFRRQDNAIKIGDSLLLVLLQQQEAVEITEVYQLYSDDFTLGIVNRWLNSAPITAGSIHNVEHEKVNTTEETIIIETETEAYAWQ